MRASQGNNFAVFQSLARSNGPNDLPAQISACLNSRGGHADSRAIHLFLSPGSDVTDALLRPGDAVASQVIDASAHTAASTMARGDCRNSVKDVLINIDN